MPNPTISFRLSKHHLALALNTIRQSEPNYQLTSTSNLVKTCFFDYLTKMNLNQTSVTSNLLVPPEITNELNEFLSGQSKNTGLSLNDIIKRIDQN